MGIFSRVVKNAVAFRDENPIRFVTSRARRAQMLKKHTSLEGKADGMHVVSKCEQNGSCDEAREVQSLIENQIIRQRKLVQLSGLSPSAGVRR